MIRARYLVFGAILAIGSFASAQTAVPSSQSARSGPPAADVNAALQSQLLRIVAPVASQPLSNDAVTVRFELTNPGADGATPNFLVQLDGRDPVRTSTTSQTFTGLAAGTHSVTVVLVDANNTLIPGARASVQFVVSPQTSSAGTQGSTVQAGGGDGVQLAGMTLDKSGQTQNIADSHLPKASSPLPLISVIGFGILVGGIVSAMKTRS